MEMKVTSKVDWTNQDLNERENKRKELEVFFPETPIIDPHHHLFPLRTNGTTDVFIASFGKPPIGKWLRDDFNIDREGVNIVASVYVEAHVNYDTSLPSHLAPVGETNFIRTVYEQNPSSQICKGIVISLNLSLPIEKIDEAISAHKKVLENSGCALSGVRLQIASKDGYFSPSPKNFAKKCVVGAQRMAFYGLPIDVWLYYHQVDELIELAQLCPETFFICDHIATPIGGKQVFDVWLGMMLKLSKVPNVYVKLGGLGMKMCNFTKDEPLLSHEIVNLFLPWFITCFELFGEDRVFFESNFPMDKVSFSYRSFWNACKKMTGLFSPSPQVRRKLLFENANNVYHLNLPSPDLKFYEFPRLYQSNL